jgi:hypothetical protein
LPPEFDNIFSSTSTAVPSLHAGETHLDAALRRDHDLIRAIDDAGSLHDRLVHSQGLCGGRCYATLLSLDEPDLRHRLTKDVMNFYPRDGIQPFVPLAARGPWIVTSHGAIVYDAAGYGMTGFGHSPDNLLAGEFIFISVQAIRMTSCFLFTAVAKPEVMANVMTSSFAQADLTHALRREIGRKWKGVKGARRMISDEKVSYILILVWAISMTSCFVYRTPRMTKPRGRTNSSRLTFHSRA